MAVLKPLLLGILAMGVILISELAFLNSFIQNDVIFPLFFQTYTLLWTAFRFLVSSVERAHIADV